MTNLASDAKPAIPPPAGAGPAGVLIVYIFLQKQLTKGITAGAVKG